jgi:hypothetical protein
VYGFSRDRGVQFFMKPGRIVVNSVDKLSVFRLVLLARFALIVYTISEGRAAGLRDVEEKRDQVGMLYVIAHAYFPLSLSRI